MGVRTPMRMAKNLSQPPKPPDGEEVPGRAIAIIETQERQAPGCKGVTWC
jgi:hypothetical protein